MRIVILSILAAGLTLSATAYRDSTRNRRSDYLVAQLKVVSTCDDAISVSVGAEPRILGPNESTTFLFYGYKSAQVSLTASLVSDPTVTQTKLCKVQAGKISTATVSCHVSGSSITLSIN